MSWVFLAVLAQFLNAIVALVDKYIVSDQSNFPKPFVYAFYTCLISGAWILVYALPYLPFSWGVLDVPSFENVKSPTLNVVALSFLASYAFFLGLVSLFNALRSADASDVVPVIGALSGVFTFGLSHYFLGSVLTGNYLWGIFFLCLGTFLVSRLRFTPRVGMLALHSGLFFSVHYIAIKGLFVSTSFDNGFFWSRIAFTLFALSLLLVPNYWNKVRKESKQTGKKGGALILGNKILAGISSILILKATDLGDVAVVQALGGVQFLFILMFAVTMGIFKKRSSLAEKPDSTIAFQKIVFVGLITIGFLLLF